MTTAIDLIRTICVESLDKDTEGELRWAIMQIYDTLPEAVRESDGWKNRYLAKISGLK